jgi:hypothetical protein
MALQQMRSSRKTLSETTRTALPEHETVRATQKGRSASAQARKLSLAFQITRANSSAVEQLPLTYQRQVFSLPETRSLIWGAFHTVAQSAGPDHLVPPVTPQWFTRAFHLVGGPAGTTPWRVCGAVWLRTTMLKEVNDHESTDFLALDHHSQGRYCPARRLPDHGADGG